MLTEIWSVVKLTAVVPLFALTLISVSQEIAIGKQANAQVRREMPRLDDAAANAYVASLGRRLVEAAPGPRFPYSFTVADKKEINAFALPGGPVWINRGVLTSATNEAQVAGVLAHEIAHVAQRHAADQITKGAFANWGLAMLGSLLGNSGGAATARTAAGLLTNGVFLKFSRDDERDADRVGLQILTRAGWDGRGMVELFEILRREQQRNPSVVDTFFSTHPSPQDRIQQLQSRVRTLEGGRRDSQAFQRVRKRLSRR